jgi:SAM-dependent methyltransferase
MRFHRLLSALHYLARADPPHRWRITHSHCPHCGGQWFVSLRSDSFMTRCLACRANVTNLSLIPVIEQHRARHAVARAWEMSTYGATLSHLRKVVEEVHASEFFPDAAPGAYVDGILNQDVQRLSFADDSLDLITSNQVFEHVQDDLQGFRECFRVLKPGGALIFSIPLHDVPATQQLALIENGALRHLATPEYHHSRHGGPRSALCFWRHSYHDIAERVSSVGFQARLVEIRFPATLREATFVVYAVKEFRADRAERPASAR